MRFITEQELQLKNRQKSIERFLLTRNERLTPGAKQFLTDHQIPIVTHDETDTAGGSSDEMMKNLALVSKHKTFFPLLEVELWEAALEARNVCSASCERITALTQLVKKIVTQNLEELPCSENEKDQPIELSEISEVQIFQPGGKIALKLRRAIIYAKTIQTCVTLKQQAALEQLIYLIAKEIEQLEKL